jgi:hypothetical protein
MSLAAPFLAAVLPFMPYCLILFRIVGLLPVASILLNKA